MAFIRWRGTCAQLLTTRYEQGHSRQICLANLHGGYAISPSVRAAIAAQYPQLHIDWDHVSRTLAAGPPAARPLSATQVAWLDVELQLRALAEQTEGAAHEAETLRHAADILTSWRARHPGGNLS
jgi:hypothetical protein